MLVTGASRIGKAGVATIVYQWGKHFDTSRVIYDYLMQGGLPDWRFQSEIKKQGSRMYTLPSGKSTIWNIIRWVTHIVRKGRYRVIHINTDSAYIAAAYIFAAKRGGIKKIVVHSHSSFIDENEIFKRFIKIILHKVFVLYVKANVNCQLACSREAARWMFGKKNNCGFIPNGIEVGPYCFDIDSRRIIRDELKIGEKVALCNIGRLAFAKKHAFLIQVFKQYHSVYEKSILYIIGTGKLESRLRKIVKKNRLEDSVIFLGQRHDIGKLLSAMDIMVMPSRFEGLPVTLVEAQMSDLPCVVSGAVTREADFTGNVRYVDSWNVDEWVSVISSIPDIRRGMKDELKKDSIFNVEIAVKKLMDELLEGL